MMINFMYQLDQTTRCPDTLLNTVSQCVCEGVSRREQHWNWETVKQIALPTVVYPAIVEGLNRTMRQRKGKSPSLPNCMSWDTGILLP